MCFEATAVWFTVGTRKMCSGTKWIDAVYTRDLIAHQAKMKPAE